MTRRATPRTSELVKLTQVWPGFTADRSTLGERFLFDCKAELKSATWGAWHLAFNVRLVDRVLFVADLAVKHTDEGTWPRDRVTSGLLRSLPLDGLLSAVRVWIATSGEPFGTDKSQTEMMGDTPDRRAWAEQRDQFAAELKYTKTAGPGRPHSRTDAELREVAEQAIAIGQQRRRGWLQELARQRRELDRDGITVRQPLKDAIKDCRNRLQYLAPARGQGAQDPPTPGVALLASWKREGDVRYRQWIDQMLTMKETP